MVAPIAEKAVAAAGLTDRVTTASGDFMLIEFGDAFDFTGSDFAGWCRDAGFRDVEIVPLTGPASAGIAYK